MTHAHLIIFTCILRNINVKLLLSLLSAVLVIIVASVNNPSNVKISRPFLNDWSEVAQRKVSGNEFHSGIVRGKKEHR